MFHVPNDWRVREGILGSDNYYGNNGCFVIPHPKILDHWFGCIASDGAITEVGQEWEHVSVEVFKHKDKPKRTPTWKEMCWIKDLFWDKEDCVIQYHPPEVDYVNIHDFVLHLWKPVGVEIIRPPKLMV